MSLSLLSWENHMSLSLLSWENKQLQPCMAYTVCTVEKLQDNWQQAEVK